MFDLDVVLESGTLRTIILTAIITTIVGMIFKQLGRAIWAAVSWPFRWLRRKLWEWIAPRNLFSLSIQSYTHHVLNSRLAKIENPVGPVTRLHLEKAFAPLRLVSKEHPEVVDLFEYTKRATRLMVLGGPGSGKTTLMKHLIFSILKNKAHPDLNSLIPVFVVLRELAAKQHTVTEAIVASFAKYNFPGAEEFVDAALKAGKMLIVLDGLDEVGASRAFVTEKVQEFCDADDLRPSPNHLLVTCRENSYQTEDLREVIPTVVRVDALTNHHMRLFLKGWGEYQGKVALELYTKLQEAAQIRDACRNPLLLGILTGLYLESDDFEVPRSRDSFYMATLDELLVQRPSRRSLEQAYSKRQKLDVLQRVALETLESVELGEDSEVFEHDLLIKHALEVLGDKEKSTQLVHELVHVNSIIRPTGVDTYTCTHRTIQEYLAAREARKTREDKEVLAKFGGRDDLLEVLLFYCGILDNIPSMRRVVRYFANQSAWRQAGECLLNLQETLPREEIKKVAKGLYGKVSKGDLNLLEDMRCLEILSALGQRRPKEFEVAATYFSRTIEALTRRGDQESSALESALASDPETALALVPGLLTQDSDKWQRTGVRILRDVGTQEALDELILLLKRKPGPVREEAGIMVAELMMSRRDDLIKRQEFLDDRHDLTIWPLETVFPGRVALAVIEAVGDAPTRNPAINAAVEASSLVGDRHRTSRRFLRRWKHAVRDVRLSLLKKTVATGVMYTPPAVFVLGALMVMGLTVWSLVSGRALCYGTAVGMEIHDTRPFVEVDSRTEAIVSAIESEYPPNASGWARLLPWNWKVEAQVPGVIEDLYPRLKARSHWNWRSWLPTEADFSALTSLGNLEEHAAKLQAAIADLPPAARSPEDRFAFLTPHPNSYVESFWWTLFTIVLSLAFFVFAGVLAVQTFPSEDFGKDAGQALLLACFWAYSLGLSADGMVTFVILVVLLLTTLLGVGLRALDWPRNPLRLVVAPFLR